MADVIQESYSGPETAEIIGVSYARLDSWSRRGSFFVPSIRQAKGTGTSRAYSFTDLCELSAIVRMRQRGLSLQQLRKVKETLMMLDLRTPWTFLIARGDDVLVAQGPEQLISILSAPGQFAFTVLSMPEVVSDVQMKACEIVNRRNKKEEPIQEVPFVL